MRKNLSRKQILSEVSLPDDVSSLSDKEKALLKYILGGMSMDELGKIFKTRRFGRTLGQVELTLEILSLGHSLAHLKLFNTEVFIDWSKANKPGYIEGFLDCKNKLKEVITNAIRPKSGRKTKQRKNRRS